MKEVAMSADPVRGKTLRWRYDDGPVKGMTFEHAFAADGTVTYRDATGTGPGAGSNEPGVPYEAEPVDDHIYVVSYLASNGFTLTTVVDTRSRKIVSFASNEKQLVSQHGRLVD
jgi:hypothetical protein